MAAYSQYLKRNRSAHLRDRDIQLRGFRRKLDQIMEISGNLSKGKRINRKLENQLLDLAKMDRRALQHAENAFSLSRKGSRNNNNHPGLQEALIMDFLHTMHSMCECILRQVEHFKQLRRMRKSYGTKHGSIRNYIEKMETDAEENIMRYMIDMRRRLDMLDKLLTEIEG